MSYQTASDAIAVANLADDAARLAWATGTIYSWRDHYVSYRTIRDLLTSLGAADARTRTQNIANAVQAADPLAHGMLLVPGDSQGNGGGVNIALAEARAMIAQLQAGGLFSQAEGDALLDLSRTNPRPRFNDWGLVTFDAGTLSHLPTLIQWEALSLDVDGWLAAIDANGAVVAGLAGITADAVAARRAAMVQAIQTYKGQIDAGQAVTMPATAAALWAQAGAA